MLLLSTLEKVIRLSRCPIRERLDSYINVTPPLIKVRSEFPLIVHIIFSFMFKFNMYL